MFVSYAQNFEDVMLWRALGRVVNGRYVDIGAYDPLADSVSLAFYERGWRGIHVEPCTRSASKLRVARPDETVIEAAAGAKAGTMKFFEIPDTGLSTADEKIAKRHVTAGFKVVETHVESVRLDTVLAQAGPEIHWLKIDVEGLEKAVLAGWRGAARPWIVVIESTVPLSKETAHKKWEHLLLGKGYRFAYFDGLNRFYVSGAHPELMAAFETGPNVFDGFTLSGTASSSFASVLTEKNRALKAESDRIQAAHREASERERKYLRKLDDARQAALTATQEAARREAERARLLHEAQQIAMRTVQSTTERLQQMVSEREAERKEFSSQSAAMAARDRAQVEALDREHSEAQVIASSAAARERALLEALDRERSEAQVIASSAAARERALVEALDRERSETQVISSTAATRERALAEERDRARRAAQAEAQAAASRERELSDRLRELQQQTQQLAAGHRARMLAFAQELSLLVGAQRSQAAQPFQPSASGRYTLAELCAYEGEAFVHAAYRALLRRTPDASGFAIYLDHLGRGMPKQQILGAIRWSEEGRAGRVKVEGLSAAYVLRRAANVPVLGVIVRFVLGLFYLTHIEAEDAAARTRMAIAAKNREREALELLESMLRRMNEAGAEGRAPAGIEQPVPAAPTEAGRRGAELRKEIRKWALGQRADE